ncbi:fucolectin-4-like [Engystomops pustulosus]|uniref:fucolectin-4-like n=1 Tax=Engystomops pustulosus TaxID=76066 RepID=UPI003AFB0874
MGLVWSLVLLGSLALTLGCSPVPGAINLARNGEASQDSDYTVSSVMGYARNAIDGVSNTDYEKGSCTHTAGINPPWWKLDLRRSYKISSVVLTNRQDCCPERLLGAEVRIGNSPDNNNPVCGTVTSVGNPSILFCCNGMEGQYVSVVIPGRPMWLTLCEVDVYEDLTTKDNKVCW